MPTVSPSGTDSTLPSRKPTTWTGSGGRPSAPVISHIAPMLTRGPCDSISRPTVRTTRPEAGIVSIDDTRAMYDSSEKPAASATACPGVAVTEQCPGQLLHLRADPGAERTEIRSHAAAPAADGRIGHPLDLRAEPPGTAGASCFVLFRVQAHGHAGVVAEPIERHAG